MIRHAILALALPIVLSAGPLSAAEGAGTVMSLGTVRLVVEVDGREMMSLRCPGGRFTIANSGKNGDAVAAIFNSNWNGELTSSGVITCEKRKD